MSDARAQGSWGGLGLALAALLAAPPAWAFDNISQGAVIDVAGGTSSAGDFLLAEAGAASSGIRTYSERRYLLQWDGLFAPGGGVIANALPYQAILGGHARLTVEGGTRFTAENANSVYLGLRTSGDAQILLPFGRGLGALTTVNNLDSVGDLRISGALRIAAGWSYLTDTHGLLLTAFVEELGQGAESNSPGKAFTNLGLTGRYDLPHKLTVIAEASWGRTPSMANSALQSEEFRELLSFSAMARKIFANGMWVGFSWTLTAEQGSTSYLNGPTYSTFDAPTVTTRVFYGIPFGRQGFP